jgi:hypothetical protein
LFSFKALQNLDCLSPAVWIKAVQIEELPSIFCGEKFLISNLAHTIPQFYHRYGHVAQVNEVDSDAQTIAHALTRGMGWGSLALNQQMMERLKPP